MGFSHFRVRVILRVILLAATIALGCSLLCYTDLLITAFLSIILVIYQVYSLIHFIEKTRRELSRFLETIETADYTDSVPVSGETDDELKAAFYRIVRDFHDVRAEREEHYRYTQTIIKHLSMGIVAFDSEGNVDLANTAAKRLFKVQRLQNINELNDRDPKMVADLLSLQPGDRKIITLKDEKDKLQLSVEATEFRRRDMLYKLISVQDIRSELEEKEMEAWQNLVRVLTHEIRNSITPIASLASTAGEMLKENSMQLKDWEDLPDISLAIDTIRSRSNGLLKFVEAFRKLYQIPKPSFEIIKVRELFARLQVFSRPECEENSIRASFRVDPESLELTADPELIEQVMINLIRNAIQAACDVKKPWIEVIARLDETGRTKIEISDNGPGISDDVQERIFIPFFTTKKEGSGIGLSLSRQIVRLHRGSITVYSKSFERTTFTLTF